MYENIEKYLCEHDDCCLIMDGLQEDRYGKSNILIFLCVNASFLTDFPFVEGLCAWSMTISDYICILEKYPVPVVVSNNLLTGLKALDQNMHLWCKLPKEKQQNLLRKVNDDIQKERSKWFPSPLGDPAYKDSHIAEE